MAQATKGKMIKKFRPMDALVVPVGLGAVINMLVIRKACYKFASGVNIVLDKLTGGYFLAACENYFDVKPRNRFSKFIATKLIHDPENYDIASMAIFLFAAGLGNMAMAYARIAYGWTVLPVLYYAWFLACGCLGGNELHYHSHMQVGFRQKGHVFKFEPFNHLCTWIVQPMSGYAPGFWLYNHVQIHHKENNGHDDIQTVSFFPRTMSNFCYFHMELPVQWFVRAPLYFYQKGNYKATASLVASMVGWYGMGVWLWKKDIFASMMVVWWTTYTKLCVNSTTEYTQHALVDPDRPMDIHRNNCILLKPTEGYPAGFQQRDNHDERYHSVHHQYPRLNMGQNSVYYWKNKEWFDECGQLTFDMSFREYARCIIFEDISKLASCMIGTGPEKDFNYEQKRAVLAKWLGVAFSREECKWTTRPSWLFSNMVSTEKVTVDNTFAG